MNRFNNVIFGQKAFIIKDNKVLIIKRKAVDIFGGMWDVPGGKLEDEETLFKGISREIKEETGLSLTKILLVLSTSKFNSSKGDRPVIFRNIYLCSAEGEVTLSKEHSEFIWVKPEDLSKYNFPGDEDFQSVIKKMPGILKAISPDVDYSGIF
jgi:8-oxo-dGTP diphosphatase